MEPINTRLKKLREKKGLSAADMAKAIGVPVSTYREWEYGRSIRGEPYLKIAETLDVSLYELFTGSPPSSAGETVAQIEFLLQKLRAQLNG